ncbi:MAG TPA: hypothetical protein VGX92_11185 [Pyrinomonadaceae bacterium]|jgi:hypothetical protein|nr:hypothetical protein [Pyrinomonadaceae bacterium]
MDCKACRNEIEEAAPGGPERTEALAHLATCGRCRSFREERLALSRLVSSLGTVAAPGDFDWRLRARLASEKRNKYRHQLWQGFAPGTHAIALAASFALLIGVAVLLKQADKRFNATPTGEGLATVTTVTSVPKNAEDNPGRTADTTGATAAARDATASSDAATGMSARAAAPRASRAKNPVGETKAPALTVATTAAAARSPLRSNDFSSSAAPVITLFSVPVNSPSQSVKVLLDEGGGVMRTVSLQPVTFGSQEILGRRYGVSRPLDAAETAENIW